MKQGSKIPLFFPRPASKSNDSSRTGVEGLLRHAGCTRARVEWGRSEPRHTRERGRSSSHSGSSPRPRNFHGLRGRSSFFPGAHHAQHIYSIAMYLKVPNHTGSAQVDQTWFIAFRFSAWAAALAASPVSRCQPPGPGLRHLASSRDRINATPGRGPTRLWYQEFLSSQCPG